MQHGLNPVNTEQFTRMLWILLDKPLVWAYNR